MPTSHSLTLWIFVLVSSSLYAQTNTGQEEEWWQKIQLKPVAALQLWSSYTIGQKVFDESTGTYEQVDNRLNFQLRRSRLGVKGQMGQRLKFNLTVAADLVGRDLLAGTEGGANNGSSPKLRLWNAYVQWKMIPEREWLNLSLGYQVPQVGRESTSSALRVSSMEKSWSQNYLRRHLVGTGPGRSVGIHIGGLLTSSSHPLWNSRYDIGVFNATNNTFNGNSSGLQTAPLLSMRYLVSYGDPEMTQYGLTSPSQFFGQRHGVTLAVSGAWQKNNDFYQNNSVLGADLLLNLGFWTIDGAWFRLGRHSHNLTETKDKNWAIADTGHLRLSHLRKVNNYHIETTLTYTFLLGGMSEEEQNDALATQHFAGEESYAEFAVNWYLNRNLKVSCSYTLREGATGAFGAGANFNNYFYQAGLGPIQRGDWLGAGLVAIF